MPTTKPRPEMPRLRSQRRDHRYGELCVTPSISCASAWLMRSASERYALRAMQRLIGASSLGDHHAAGRMPVQVDLFVPGDSVLGMADRIRLRDTHDLAARELRQIDRQVAHIGNLLHCRARSVFIARRYFARQRNFL